MSTMERPPRKSNQTEAVEWAQWWGRGVLADEPGLGKSRSAIESFDGSDTLVVAPSMVLKTGVWDDEIERWSDYPGSYVQVSYAMLNDRIMGPEGGSKPVKRLRPEYNRHWDTIILDESHMIKGRDSKWTWAVERLSKQCDQMLLLTGTPIPNWAHEVFTLLKVIYVDDAKRGERLGSFWRWAGEWFDTSPTRWSNGKPAVGQMLECAPVCSRRDADDPCEHYLRFARENFGDRFMRHLRRDCLDLPPLRLTTRRFELDPDVRRSYRELARDFATDIGPHEVLAWGSGAQNVILDKLTTSPWLLTKDGEPNGGKFELLKEDLRRRAGAPTVVFAHYRDSVEAVARVASNLGHSSRFVHGGTKDSDIASAIRDFKAGRVDVLAGSLETMAEGITLTIADTAIRLERSYKPSRNIQATYRIHRLGQSERCEVIDYVADQTVDSRKERLLQRKSDHQMRTLTAAELVRYL